MTRTNKIFTYATGFLLGCLVLSLIPRKEAQPKRHPWHAQTAPVGTYPMEVTDDSGRTVLLESQPRHFISLAPSVTEMLFAMDMGDHLLAVTQWCDYPDEARALRDAGAHIGSMDQPNRETIAAYSPDLIVGTDLTPPEVYAALENPPRTQAIVLQHNSMDDVMEDIALLGKATGVPGNALRLISRLKDQRDAVQERLQPYLGEPARKVLFLLSIDADKQPGWAPGEGTWIHDLLVQSNAKNVAAEIGLSWGEVSFETLLALDPEVLLIRDGSSESSRDQLRQTIASLPSHPVWGRVTAVREGRIHILPHGPLNIPGPRIMDAYASVAAAVWEPQSGQIP